MLGHSGGVPGVVSSKPSCSIITCKSTTRSGTVSCCECVFFTAGPSTKLFAVGYCEIHELYREFVDEHRPRTHSVAPMNKKQQNDSDFLLESLFIQKLIDIV
jgi:hypothetical protein